MIVLILMKPRCRKSSNATMSFAQTFFFYLDRISSCNHKKIFLRSVLILPSSLEDSVLIRPKLVKTFLGILKTKKISAIQAILVTTITNVENGIRMEQKNSDVVIKETF